MNKTGLLNAGIPPYPQGFHSALPLLIQKLQFDGVARGGGAVRLIGSLTAACKDPILFGTKWISGAFTF